MDIKARFLGAFAEVPNGIKRIPITMDSVLCPHDGIEALFYSGELPQESNKQDVPVIHLQTFKFKQDRAVVRMGMCNECHTGYYCFLGYR